MKTIIWDFDGTLFDSYPSIVKGLSHVLTKNKIPNNIDILEYVKKKLYTNF